MPYTGKALDIIQAATRCFLQSGYGQTSMEEIAAAAPVSKATLYKHFADKKDLFIAVMTSRCEGFLPTVNDIPPQPESVDNIRATLTETACRYLEILNQDESVALYRIIVAEAWKFPELRDHFYSEGPGRSRRCLVDYLKSAHKNKLLNIDDPSQAANFFLSMLRGDLHLRRTLDMESAPRRREREKLAAQVVDVFMRAYA